MNATGKKFVMIHGKKNVKLLTAWPLFFNIVMYLTQFIFYPHLILIVLTSLVLCSVIGFGVFIFIGTERKLILANLFSGVGLLIMALYLCAVLIINSLKINSYMAILVAIVFLLVTIGTWIFLYKKEYLNYKNSISSNSIGSNRKKSIYWGFIGGALGSSLMQKLDDNTQFLIFNLLCIPIMMISILYGSAFYIHRYYRLSKKDSWKYQIIYDED